jgi:hypothetical protein
MNWDPSELHDMPETCALDVAERGGATLEEVGRLLRVTRERVRQIGNEASRKIRRSNPQLEDAGELATHHLAAAQDQAPGNFGVLPEDIRTCGESVTMGDTIRAGFAEWYARKRDAEGGSRPRLSATG